jgi:endoglucanase
MFKEASPMKRLLKKLFSAAIALLMLVSVFASMPLTASAADDPRADGAADWAKAEVSQALQTGIVPNSVANAGWFNGTTRLSAAEAMVLLIEKASGKTMNQHASERGWNLTANGFSDTDSQAVTFLKYAEVTDGIGNNLYNPSGSYNRAQAVTMIGRAAEAFLGVTAQGTNPFTDVYDWAAPYVGYAAEAGITDGIGNGLFGPDMVLENQHTAIFCLRAYNAWNTEPGVMRGITAKELVADMGIIGTNHARALDRIEGNKSNVGYIDDPNPNDAYSKVQWMTLWEDGVTASVPSEFAGKTREYSHQVGYHQIGSGEFYTLEKFAQVIKDFKDAGYKAVRLPVSWTYWANSSTHEIDKEWMDLVESCVKIILDNGLYCIINTHEDYMSRSWVGDHWEEDWMSAQYKDYVDARYTSLWTQIAERFRDYGDYLLFESFNEPVDGESVNEKIGFDKRVENGIARVNEMQDLFMKTVRGTGGNNATRFLSLTHYFIDIERSLDGLRLPQDKNIIVQAHYYFHKEDWSPVSVWSRENPADKAQVDEFFALIKKFMDKTGVPVILGEFGNTTRLTLHDRIDQATYILEKAKALGVPAFWWECTMDSEWDRQMIANAFSLYNRNEMKWEYPEILGAMMDVTNGKTVSNTIASFDGTAKEVAFSAEAQSFISGADKSITYKRVSIDGIEIIAAYRDNGEKKPVIFMLHGGGGRKENMLGSIENYAKEGFYAISLDVAGCGDSQVGPIMAYKAFDVTVGYIDTLVEYANTLPNADASRFAVGGGSMGGTISFCYAARGKYAPKVILPDLGTPDLTLNSDGPMFDCFDKGKSGQPMTMPKEELLAFAKGYSPINMPERFLGVAIYARNGMKDDVTPPTGCKNLESILKALGHTDMVFNYYENAGHGGDINDNGAGLRFLKEHMGM